MTARGDGPRAGHAASGEAVRAAAPDDAGPGDAASGAVGATSPDDAGGAGRAEADVVVVGGGPAGLAAAVELRRRGAGRVVVLEREAEAGGIPRHADHQGYGLRDLHRVLAGPAYARRNVERASAAGADIRTGVQVTGWATDGGLELTSPAGRETLHAPAVLLATGCRERPRSARWVPGDRPQGVMTTGTLQQLVSLAGARPGRRAVVVGAEHVSFSALLTLAHGGARAVAMTTEHARHQSFAAFRLGAAARFRTPLLTRTRVAAIHGRRRVEAVTLLDLATGATRRLDCDLVVFTGDWIPDHELAVLGELELDRGTRGPAVDAAGRTSRPGVFAAGNLLHGAETADVAALEGRRVAAAITAGTPWPATLPVLAEDPLDWVVPNRLVAGGAAPPAGVVSGGLDVRPRLAGARRAPAGLLIRASEPLTDAHVRAEQDGRTLADVRLARVQPGRSSRLPAGWVADADPAGGPVRLRVLRARRRA